MILARKSNLPAGLSSKPGDMTVEKLVNPNLRKFMVGLHKLEGEEEKSDQHLCFHIKDLTPSLQNFKFQAIYDFFGELACSSLVKKLDPLADFFTGILGLLLVQVDEFLGRKAVPAKTTIIWPSNFSLRNFESVFLHKAPKKEMKFRSGSMPALPACSLFEWIPVVEQLLVSEEKLANLKGGSNTSLGGLIKPCKKAAELQALQSGSSKTAQVGPILDTLYKNFDSIFKLEQSLESSKHWSGTEPVMKRLKEFAQACLLRHSRVYESLLKVATNEVEEAYSALREKVADKDSESPLLKELLDNSLDQGQVVDRLGNTPDKFFGAVQEQFADFVYTACSKILMLKTLLQQCVSKVGFACGHQCLQLEQQHGKAKATCATAESALRLLVHKKHIFAVEMVLADMIVPSQPYVSCLFSNVRKR